MLLFCYGSNGPKQLKQRLGHAPQMKGAVAEGYKRVFRGFSENWNGGVASLKKGKDAKTFGSVASVSKADIETLDRYEGYPDVYSRKKITVLVNGQPKSAIVYIHNDNTPSKPSTEYLKACARNVGAFWSNPDGTKVTWKDFDTEG